MAPGALVPHLIDVWDKESINIKASANGYLKLEVNLMELKENCSNCKQRTPTKLLNQKK